MTGAPDLSIVICTYQRPDLLEDAIVTSLSQTVNGPFSFEVLVVDNCAEQSARPLVEAIAARGGLSGALRYTNETRTNIAHARNCGVAESQGRYVAFVDDDNRVPPEWVGTVMEIMEETGADVLFGDVDPVFPDDVCQDTAALLAFWFQRNIPGVSEGVVAVEPHGHLPGVRTCNVVLRRETCFPEGEQWFDPTFGRTGGEDTDYFIRLFRRFPDIQVRTSQKAIMTELIPAPRVSEDFVVWRTFVGGQLYALMRIKNASNKLTTSALIKSVGLMQCMVYGPRLGFEKLMRRKPSLKARLAFAGASGKLRERELLRHKEIYR